ncbi:MAG: efflux RND transporter periplasmic adaptor subunit [Pseudomonadota bacterium]
MTTRRGASACAAAAALTVSVAFAAPADAQGGRPAGVLVESAEVRELVDTRRIIGQFVASRETDVAARVAGVVSEVTFRTGDRVEQGQILVRLDSSLIAIERNVAMSSVAEANAGVTVAEAALKQAEQTFRRQAALRSSRAFSKSQFEDTRQAAAQARAELARATAQLKSAEAAIARIDYQLEHVNIVAPFNGTVVTRMAQPGAYIAIGSAIAKLLDVAELELLADVPAEIVGALETGREVDGTLANGKRVSAVVRAILPVQAVSTRTRPVRFTLKGDALTPADLARGASVTLEVPVSKPREVLTIPKDALVQGPRGWMVFVDADGKATPRAVEIGQAAGGRIEVRSGVAAGDRVVVRGNERLRPGQPIQASPAGAQKPQAAENTKS